MAGKLALLMWSVILGLLWAVGDVSAQFQDDRQQTGGLSGGLNTTGPGGQQGGFGMPSGGGGGQFGQPGQGGGIGQNASQQPAAGSAEAMRNNYENMSGRERRRATFNFVVESLNEMRESRQARNRQRRAPSPVRVRIRPAFSVAPIDSGLLNATLQDTLAVSAQLRGVTSTAQVTVQGRRAILSGTVTDDYESAVLEKMLALQPGVSEVENRLAVQAEPTASETILPTPPPVQ